MILILFIISLMAVSAVSAGDNATFDASLSQSHEDGMISVDNPDMIWDDDNV